MDINTSSSSDNWENGKVYKKLYAFFCQHKPPLKQKKLPWFILMSLECYGVETAEKLETMLSTELPLMVSWVKQLHRQLCCQHKQSENQA